MGKGCAYHRVVPTTYESHATFLIEATGIKLPVESFSLTRLLSENHEEHVGSFSVIARAIRENQLESLSCFEEIHEDDYVAHILENLKVEQDEDEPTIYEVTCYNSYPDDAQLVLTSIIDHYEAALEEQLHDEITEQMSSLGVLYGIAKDSLAQEKANNAPQGVIDRLEERMADIVTQGQSLEYYANDGLGAGLGKPPKVMNFVVLQNPTYGEPSWPILHKCLLLGFLSGLAIGIALLMLIELIKIFVSSPLPVTPEVISDN